MGFLFVFIVFAALLIVVWPFSWIYNFLLMNFPVLASVDADDILLRVTMVIVALVVWYVYSRFNLPSMQLGKLNRRRTSLLIYSFIIGCVAVLAFYTAKCLMGYGFLEWERFPADHIWRTLLWYLLGALTVAFIEEAFFRGIVYKAFWRDLQNKMPAALLAAAFFGSLHWISFAWLLRWAAGEENLIQTFVSLEFINASSVGMFFFITALGLLLIYTYEYMGSLYAAIGLHAGMVFAARVGGKVAISFSQDGSMDILKASVTNAPYLGFALLIAALLVIFVKKVRGFSFLDKENPGVL
ncbi:CPBP family glutamic-type intramembrane protease [Propionispora vibrioides]|uniref:CAAX protease self-immunity n=1 Tax=Propionispora vibrioides TaxID=112903 RepID=A0A1H8S316_9FIRM|nr:CPBP family glutamic-type intramembrane protease [Propionispora vibrioides]SEO73050.1 CAAX protease self-immunity [Propionispora vibrioides]